MISPSEEEEERVKFRFIKKLWEKFFFVLSKFTNDGFTSKAFVAESFAYNNWRLYFFGSIIRSDSNSGTKYQQESGTQ